MRPKSGRLQVATGLNSLELAVFGYSAYVEDYISQRRAHGDLHEPVFFTLPVKANTANGSWQLLCWKTTRPV